MPSWGSGGERRVETMQVKYSDLRMAFDFASMDGGMDIAAAYVRKETGKIYWKGDAIDPEEEELPDDLEDSEKYLRVPDSNALGHGKPLALDFTREVLPDDYDEVRDFFRRRGAFRYFKALLDRRNAVERWHRYQEEAMESAIRDWCEENSIALEE